MRQVHFGNYWEDSSNYIYIKGTNKIINKNSLIEDLNYLKNNNNVYYHSTCFGYFIKNDNEYKFIDNNGSEIFSSNRIEPNDWFDEIPDKDFDKYEKLFFD